jgi:hypothetical protein
MRLPAADPARPRWLQRAAAVLGLAGLMGAVPPAQAARDTLEGRVQAVRSALQAQAEVTDPAGGDGAAAPSRRRVAWPNWGNWTNWNNWNNWPNWSNWGNWFNR